MDKNNFSLIDHNQSSNIELVDVLKKYLNENLEDITIVFNEMPSIGIFNPYVLLDLLVDKKIKLLKDFFKKETNILKFNFSKKNLNYNFDIKGKKIFNLKKHIKDGTYHDIFLVNNDQEYQNMILRKQRDNTKVDFFDSCSDFFIHAFLSLYHSKILNKHNVIPKIHYLGINNKINKFMGIMDLFNGTIFDILVDSKIKNKIKKKVIFKCLHQISLDLVLLQDNFKFNHNDLKVNNIFYQLQKNEDISDIKFYLADFGFSRLKIIHPKTKEEVILIGGALLNYSDDTDLHSFIPSKDLYFLIHNIYSYSNQNIKKSLETLLLDLGDFNNELTLDNNWLKIYDDKIVRNNYIPINFLKILNCNKIVKRYLSKA
tara:strand:+ start:104 stop:1219 length:1116 start_codon:yes stop_codon:yes gene_type:complete